MPGSERGHSTRDDFFQTRPGHVYLADRNTTAIVEIAGPRVTLRIELVQLDPALVDPDEDLVQHSSWKPGGRLLPVAPPNRRMLPDQTAEEPGQIGALAAWADSTPGFDAPR